MKQLLNKEYFSSIARNNELNIAEKGGLLMVGGVIKGFIEPLMTGMEVIKNKTGIDIERKMIESIEKEVELRENHPTKWALKKLALGTAKGILFGTLGVNLFGNDASN